MVIDDIKALYSNPIDQLAIAKDYNFINEFLNSAKKTKFIELLLAVNFERHLTWAINFLNNEPLTNSEISDLAGFMKCWDKYYPIRFKEN